MLIRLVRFLIFLNVFIGTSFFQRVSFAETKSFEFRSFDGFKLPVTVTLPKTKLKKVVVFVHGAGPNSMDGYALRPRKQVNETKRPFLREISDALVEAGFTTIRFNKRSYEIQKRIKNETFYVESKEYNNFKKDPVRYFVDDAAALVNYSLNKYRKSKIYILGHSQGAHIALLVANKLKGVAGVALIGYANHGLSALAFEKAAYRSNVRFRELDKNADNRLTQEEISVDSETARTLQTHLAEIDLNKNSKISLSEFQGSNYAAILPGVEHLYKYDLQSANYPRFVTIIRDSNFKILFLQGNRDSQTPSYHAKAIQFLNNTRWKKDNMRFVFFPKLGHMLTNRKNYLNPSYNSINQVALSTLVTQMITFFK